MEGESSGVQELPHSIPDEIVEEILTRLPVKSLLRFRCVSKSWRSLISSPAFIKAHLKIATNISMHSHNRLMCISADSDNHFREISLRFLLRGAEVESNYVVTDPDLPMRIVGSCNGMVCVALEKEKLYLWNPSIRKAKCLPSLDIGSGFGCYMKDGFGYEESNDDYKVVAISYCVFDAGPYKVEIFSLKANAWRRIEDFDFGNPVCHSGKYVNGKLHWLVDNDGIVDIFSLDLSSETFGKVGTPHHACTGSCSILEYDDPCMTLGLFKESLCMLFDDHKTRMDLWVMNDYGVPDSWTRVFTVAHLGNPGFYPHSLRSSSLNDDEILFLYGCVIIIYDLKHEVFRYPLIRNVAAIQQADVYVESLVSPFVDEPDHQQE